VTALTQLGADFKQFTMLYLDATGHFLDPVGTEGDGPRPVLEEELRRFLKRNIVLPDRVTDVFIWVHGWQNDELRANETARRLFANLDEWFHREYHHYPRLGVVVPAFVAVHWPSSSTPGLLGYKMIRNRAKQMTTHGNAAFFLASLLGYLDADNKREFNANRKVLVAKDGFYVHCLGHSFGGRFLTAAIKAASEAPVGKVLAAHRDTGYPFNVDSLCVLQMAAGKSTFGSEFSSLLTSPICGPIILTHSNSDSALCNWHFVSEGETSIGCGGATAPADRIGSTSLRSVDSPYSNADFAKDITNVDSSAYFRTGGWLEGAHSDFWHKETLHLITSVVEQVRR
jgi:hypothetical protein